MASNEAGFGRQRGQWEEGCGHKELLSRLTKVQWALQSKGKQVTWYHIND